MVDWKGLLNWSLKYTDGTKPSNFKEMAPEDQKWLEEAFESVTFNEFKETIKRLDELKALPEDENDKELMKNKLGLVEDISILCDNIDIVRTVIKAKRLEEIIGYVFNTKNKELKLEYCSLLALMLQNHKFAQEAALGLNILNIVSIILNEEDPDIISKLLYVLCGFLYGEYTEVRKRFIFEKNGLEFLKTLLMRKYTPYLRRVIGILNELTKFEDEKDDQTIRTTTLEFLRKDKSYFVFVDLLFGSFKEDKLSFYEDIRTNLYNLFTHIYCLFEKKDLTNIVEKTKVMLKNSALDQHVKDFETQQLNEILSTINPDDNVAGEVKKGANINVHFIDPKNIKLEAKDLENLTIIDSSKVEKKEESKVFMLK